MPGRAFAIDKEMQADIALNQTSDMFPSTLHLLNLRNLDSREATISKRRQSQALGSDRASFRNRKIWQFLRKLVFSKSEPKCYKKGKQWDGLQVVPTSVQIRAAVAGYMESQGLGLALCVLSSLLNQSLTEIKTWSFCL